MPALWALGGVLRCRLASMWPLVGAAVGALLLQRLVREASPMPALWALGDGLPCCRLAAMWPFTSATFGTPLPLLPEPPLCCCRCPVRGASPMPALRALGEVLP